MSKQQGLMPRSTLFRSKSSSHHLRQQIQNPRRRSKIFRYYGLQGIRMTNNQRFVVQKGPTREKGADGPRIDQIQIDEDSSFQKVPDHGKKARMAPASNINLQNFLPAILIIVEPSWDMEGNWSHRSTRLGCGAIHSTLSHSQVCIRQLCALS